MKIITTTDTPEKIERQYVKRKLFERFGDEITIAQRTGKDDVVVFRTAKEELLRQISDAEVPTSESIHKKILKIAANILIAEVESVQATPDVYPRIDEVNSVEKVMYAFLYIKTINKCLIALVLECQNILQ